MQRPAAFGAPTTQPPLARTCVQTSHPALHPKLSQSVSFRSSRLLFGAARVQQPASWCASSTAQRFASSGRASSPSKPLPLQQPASGYRPAISLCCHAQSSTQHATDSSASSSQSNLAVEVSDLHVSFGQGPSGKQVLSGAHLMVQRGTFHILLGPNGCGKSTLLRVLGGLLRPDSGTFWVDQPCGFVFQNPDHQIVMPTVAADVAFGLGRYKLSAKEVQAQVVHALELVHIQELAQRPTHTLSGGQKQRVAIAGALAENPKVLLLDELTTFVDADDQQNVLEAVRSVVGGPEQVTALWVTHRLEELQYADSASYMDGGRIQFSGSAAATAKYMRSLGAKF